MSGPPFDPPTSLGYGTAAALSFDGEETLLGEATTLAGASRRDEGPRPLGRGDAMGRYLLIEALGRGAMGEVFAAYDPDLDRRVAIKVVRTPEPAGSTSRERFLQEAKAMARIDHPNVIRVYDVGIQDDTIFIAMELVEGAPLDRWLERERSRAEILDVFIGAARGLAAAHAAGVVHRDFKPANVMVRADGRPKVGDFGLAGFDDPHTPSPDAPELDRAIGTPAYMSPEHFAGAGIDGRSDQFSFGVALHEALFGRRPFLASSLAELAAQVFDGERSAELASRRGRLDTLLRRTLQADPAARFTSMEELLAALERIRRPRWTRWALAGTAAAVLGGAALWTDAEPSPCAKGSERVQSAWSPAARRALRVAGTDMTDAHLSDARTRLVSELDAYASQWADAYDASCRVVGPEMAEAGPAERVTAQCLENRLGSLRGLVELVGREPLHVSRVGPLLDTLPELDECTTGRWIPYPVEPERAARAAELRERLVSIKRLRLAERHEGLEARSTAALADARELADPYTLAFALREHARLLTVLRRSDEGRPLLDEAIELSIEAGHDRMAADVANIVLLTIGYEAIPDAHEAEHVAALARGLARRTGHPTPLLALVSMNVGGIYRRLGRPEEALVHDQRAVELFEEIGDRPGRAKARLNVLVSLHMLGKLEQVGAEIDDAASELERWFGESSPMAMTARRNQVALLSYLGHTEQAAVRSAALLERARANFQPSAASYQEATFTHALAVLNLGRLDEAERTADALREAAPEGSRLAIESSLIRLNLATSRGQLETVVDGAQELCARIDPTEEPALSWRCRLELARVSFLQGQVERCTEILGDPIVLRLVEDDALHEHTRSETALLAAACGAPPPPDTTWISALFPVEPRFVGERTLVEASRAMSAGDRGAARAARDELRALYHERDVGALVLDAWLERTPTPSG